MFRVRERDFILGVLNGALFTCENYNRGQIIKVEGDVCSAVGVVLQGSVDIKRMLGSRVVHISSFGCGDVFGEVIAFSDVNRYPATVVAASDCEVLYIQKKDFISFCASHQEFLEDFIRGLTNKIFLLNKSITNSTFSSIRQKICNFLLSEYNIQKDYNIKLNMTKEKLAEFLGVNRPSLSRELINMKEDGIIVYSRDSISILDFKAVEDSLM